MAGRKTEMGPTGTTVAGNVARLRAAQGLNYTELSQRVANADREISPLAIRRIEEQQRRVDVDDLMALAVAFGVSPVTLLNEDLEFPESPIAATGIHPETSAKSFYLWLTGELELDGGERGSAAWMDYMVRVAPRWRKTQIAQGLREMAVAQFGEGAELEALKKKYSRDRDGDN